MSYLVDLQRGDHLHDLHLAVSLTSVNMAAVRNEKFDEFAGRGRWQQGGVILLREYQCLEKETRKFTLNLQFFEC